MGSIATITSRDCDSITKNKTTFIADTFSAREVSNKDFMKVSFILIFLEAYNMLILIAWTSVSNCDYRKRVMEFENFKNLLKSQQLHLMYVCRRAQVQISLMIKFSSSKLLFELFFFPHSYIQIQNRWKE